MVEVGSGRGRCGAAGRVWGDEPRAKDVPVVICRVEGLTGIVPSVASNLAQALEYARRSIELLLIGQPRGGIHGRRGTQGVAKSGGAGGSRARQESVVVFVESHVPSMAWVGAW